MSRNVPALLPQAPLPAVPPIDLGDKTALLKRSTDALDIAQSMVIDSPEMAEQMQAECASWGADHDAVEERRKFYTRPFDEAKKTLMGWFRPVTDNFAQARDIGRQKMAQWQREENARVERERREATERARKEQERLQAEARAKEEAAREEARRAEEARQAAARAANDADRRRLEEEARSREQAAAQQMEAAATDAAIAQVITPPPVVEAARIRGASFRDTVAIEVVDKSAALAWFAANPMFAECVEFNESKLKAMHKALGDKFNVAGVKVTKDITTSSRKAAA